MNFRVICILIMAATVIKETRAQSISFTKLDSLIVKGMSDWQIPGLAMAIVQNDSIIYVKGFGSTDISTRNGVNSSTVFPIASTTKSITATAMAKVLGKSNLSWDECVQEVYPRFRLEDPYLSRNITIRDILSHCTGLPGNDLIWYGNDVDSDILLGKINEINPTSPFRSSFQYNNLMYVLAGKIIGHLSGGSYEGYLKEEFFEPLSMTSTTIGMSEDNNDLAQPHALINKKLTLVDPIDLNSVAPAGGIYSNVGDMALWLKFLLSKKDDNQFAKAISETQSPQNILPEDPFLNLMFHKSKFISYGMGWFVHSYQGAKIVEHTGNTDGYSTHIALMPDDNLGLVILTNLNTNFFSFAVKNSIIDMVLGNKPMDWHTHYYEGFNKFLERMAGAKEAKEKAQIKETLPSLELSKYTGTYFNDFYGKVRVESSSKQLIIQFLNGFKGKGMHWHYNTFQIEWENKLQGKSYVNFRLNDAGSIMEMSIDQIGLFSLEESFKKIN